MNQGQSNKLNMFEATSQLLESNDTIWNSNSVISTVVSAFDAHIDALNGSDQAQKTSTKGITETKAQAKMAMVNATMTLVNAGKAFASATSNTTLKNAMSHSKTEILHAIDTDADDICQNIHDALSPTTIITGLAPYGADANALQTQQTAINTFSALIGTPRATKAISMNATINIDQHFDDATTLLKDQLDPLMEQYQSSEAEFYNEYKAVRVIQNIGHRHTVILDGFIYNGTHASISGATVVLSGDAKHQKITDETGAYKFTRLHPGNYTIKVSAPGYATQTLAVEIAANGHFENDFVLIAG